MGIISDSWLLDIFSLITAILAIFITYVKWRHSYWERRNVATLPPTFFVGNLSKIFMRQESFGSWVLRYYQEMREKKVRYGGMYALLMPQFVPLDPYLIKDIMINEFDHFVDRGVYMNEESDPLSAHLFSLEGAKWRNLRAKLSPTFTSGKMKMMFETLVKCGDQLKEEMDKTAGKESIDIKEMLIRFTTDIIGSCAFGIDCNTMKNPDNEFNKNGKLFFEPPPWWHIISLLSFTFPDIMKLFNTPAVYPKSARFFEKLVHETVEYREKNNIYRKDFMHLLLQLKNRGQLTDDTSVLNSDNEENKRVKLSLGEISAQAFIFFLAGFETSSTTMTFCLYELAANPEIQEKVRQEVKDALQKHGDNLTYDAVMDMHYMEKVINETLRKYPPLPSLNRICTKDYKVPNSDLVLKKGEKINIPVLGIQRDPEYYPDPDKFDPERFSEENKAKRPPCTFLPFGDGPRICIGLRFGMMQTKVGLSVLLNNYRFTVSLKTKQPLQLHPTSFILATEGGLWLDYEKI